MNLEICAMDRNAPPAGLLDDPTIFVSRLSPIIYPPWVTEVLHREYEHVGLNEYHPLSVQFWYAIEQKSKDVKGHVIYEQIVAENLIHECLDLRDLWAIFAKGRHFFPLHFGDVMLYAWKSAVKEKSGHICVPFLMLFQGVMLTIDWQWLDLSWGQSCPAGKFSTKTLQSAV